MGLGTQAYQIKSHQDELRSRHLGKIPTAKAICPKAFLKRLLSEGSSTNDTKRRA